MHESWSEPGSVASMDCIKSFPRFAVQEISADKMIMGTPSYGYDWDVTNPDQNAMKQWDEIKTYDLTDSFDNVFLYGSDHHQHVIRYENEKQPCKRILPRRLCIFFKS